VNAPIQVDAPFCFGAQLEARIAAPGLAEQDFLLHRDRVWSWGRYRNECVRMAHFLLHRLGPVDAGRPGHVAIMLDNHFELLSLYGGCGYAGLTLFGINTGLRGATLAGVLNQSKARLLVVDQRLLPEVMQIWDRLEHVAPENLLVLRTRDDAVDGHDLMVCIEAEEGGAEVGRAAPDVAVRSEQNLMVIYTSGTTGLPKGINNNHFKLLVIGMNLASALELDRAAVGYACMPLFHSNSIFLGFQPAFHAGARLAIRERFSARHFASDVLHHGVTYWNYVGEPVHYVLEALRNAYDGDEERILEAVARHPDNRFRFAVGNGAAPPDLDRFVRWLGLEDMFELYGSTEAAISTFRKKGDPRGSVGEVTDPNVRILGPRGASCPAANLDPAGKITNYEEAVGEICRVASDTALFQGYFENAEANAGKYREGVYHSGDLGHILERDGRRFLYFDGRTDDWIRKDGENFSAAQVARIIQEHPDVMLAAAYGVPCAVSDELVMVALKLRPSANFDPAAFFRYCDDQVKHGGMDRKWFPDFVRLVEEFEYTQTQKILVRNLKAAHFHPGRLAGARIYWRQRGDDSYHPFGDAEWKALREGFERAERLELLAR